MKGVLLAALGNMLCRFPVISWMVNAAAINKKRGNKMTVFRAKFGFLISVFAVFVQSSSAIGAISISEEGYQIEFYEENKKALADVWTSGESGQRYLKFAAVEVVYERDNLI